MKGLRLGIAVVGIVGIAACFLPFLGGEPSLSFWKYAEAFQRPIKAYFVIGGFGLAVLMALLASARGGMGRLQAVLALIGFGLAIVPEEIRKGFDAGGIGGKLLLVAAVAGGLFALVMVLKPERS